MAKFRFSLRAVLEHREMIEEQKQRAVAALEAERVRLENAIRECQRGIALERDDMRRALTAGDVRAARAQSAASVRLAAVAQRAVVELAGLHRRLEAARAELLEATKRKKAVELLKGRRYEEWKREQDRREMAALDELAVMAAGRKDGEP
jgi:flagellar FliJ protein